MLQSKMMREMTFLLSPMSDSGNTSGKINKLSGKKTNKPRENTQDREWFTGKFPPHAIMQGKVVFFFFFFEENSFIVVSLMF